MSKPIYVSYSGATKYKACPEKYFLGKRYETRLISSAFPFGKATEVGVEAMLLGKSLDDAITMFIAKWEVEDERGTPRPVFDNLAIEYYSSDFDANLLAGEETTKQVREWTTELFDAETDPYKKFDEVSDQLKKDESKLTDEELTFYNRVMWLCCLIRGQVMLTAFHDELLPKLTLLKVDGKPASQIEVSIKNEEGDKVVGFMDFLVKHADYEEPIILDLKTAAYPYEDHALRTSEQLRTYVAVKGAELGTRRAGYAVLLKKVKVDRTCDKCGAPKEGMAKNCKKKDCGGTYSVNTLRGETQFITRQYDDELLQDVLNDYDNVTVAIKNEVTFKNPANCTAYGRKCEFYDLCWNKAKPEELQHLKDKNSKE